MAARRSGSTSPDDIALLAVVLDRGASVPLGDQLYRGLRDLILAGRLSRGSRLPSTRQFAVELGVSRTITLEAFARLADEGFIRARHGSGHEVIAGAVPAAGDRHLSQGDFKEQHFGGVWAVRGRPFDPSWQDPDFFPADDWGRMLGRGWRRHRGEALARHWAGLPALRDAVADHLSALRGEPLSRDNVMITGGLADAVPLLSQYARQAGLPLRAWVEDPGLGSLRLLLEANDVVPVPVPVDKDGLRVDEGLRRAPDAALAFVTPARQFPLGLPMSLARRQALLAWARQTGAIVVNDEYDAEIRFGGRATTALSSLEPQAPVVTLGSFSKLTFAGLRLGSLTARPDLVAALIDRRSQALALVPTPSQAALAEFIATGALARHLRALRRKLTASRRLLIDRLTTNAAGLLDILPQETGMHLSVRLGQALAGIDDRQIAESAEQVGLTLVPLSGQYVTEPPVHGLLLGYAGWSDRELAQAVDQLVALLNAIRG